jgi:ribosomal protein L14
MVDIETILLVICVIGSRKVQISTLLDAELKARYANLGGMVLKPLLEATEIDLEHEES